MARMIGWNTAAFQQACVGVTMARLEAGAELIAEDMRTTLKGQIKGQPVTRHPGRKMMRVNGRLIPSISSPVWMERDPGALVATIRVVRKHNSKTRNVWIMAGNYKTWWALQTEYGRGGWKGGRKSFMRPAMKRAPQRIRTVIENGNGATG